jgi:HD-like signal output (HDOD) protein
MSEATSVLDVVKGCTSFNSPSIPVFHAVSVQLQEVLSCPHFDLKYVNRLISFDPSLVGQVLGAANSSIYTGLRKVATIEDAIMRLGQHKVTNVALLACLHAPHPSHVPKRAAVMHSLWAHAFCCAAGSHWLANKCHFKDLAQLAFLAGLLHDIGKLSLLMVVDEIFRTHQLHISDLNEVLRSLHVEHGYLLMRQWHMPDIYTEVVAQHEKDRWSVGNATLGIVRLANLACRKLGIGIERDPGVVLVATAEAEFLGLSDMSLGELEIFIEDTYQVISSSP